MASTSDSGSGSGSGSGADEKRKLILRSSDGHEFEVEAAVAMQCQTIRHMIEDDCADGPIPLANVAGGTLAKVVEYCKKHAASQPDADPSGCKEIKAWDAEFMKVDQATLFELITAANYLNVNDLLQLGCQTVADMIKGKTPGQIRETFDIKNDFSPEEEEQIRRENQWTFEV